MKWRGSGEQGNTGGTVVRITDHPAGENKARGFFICPRREDFPKEEEHENGHYYRQDH